MNIKSGLIGVTIALSAQFVHAIPEWSTPERGTVGWKEPALGEQQSLPGSPKRYTQQEIDDKFNAPDWYPDAHAPMPLLVSNGNQAKIWACASCHLASGMGHPESSRLAGLDKNYMVRQMKAFRNGSRKDYSGHMNRMAGLMSDHDIEEVSQWFAGLQPIRWYKVQEAQTVPETYIDNTRMRLIKQNQQGDHLLESIAGRVIELPSDLARVKKRDPYTGFIAYVPPGSVEKGRLLVEEGTQNIPVCQSCHGEGLKGSVIAPNIAGLSPIYTIRQLYGFKEGARNEQMMKLLVDSMTRQEIIAISAYLATLEP